MELIAEDAVLGALQDSTNCKNVVNEQQQPLAGPPAGFIPRSKPTTPPINRKIRSFQLAKWGPEEELTLKPHRFWLGLSALVFSPTLIPSRALRNTIALCV